MMINLLQFVIMTGEHQHTCGIEDFGSNLGGNCVAQSVEFGIDKLFHLFFGV
jgi:hypothetical protein